MTLLPTSLDQTMEQLIAFHSQFIFRNISVSAVGLNSQSCFPLAISSSGTAISEATTGWNATSTWNHILRLNHLQPIDFTDSVLEVIMHHFSKYDFCCDQQN